MYRRAMRAATVASTLAGLLLEPRPAGATPRSFVTLRDDGTLSASSLTAGPDEITKSVMTAYDATGAARPDVISLWTTFPMDGDVIETLFDPMANDVRGIGLETAYPPTDGTFASNFPPTRAILLHNDATALEARAKAQNAPVDGLGRYLFLLELSHVWGPALQLPATDGGPPPTGLIGFDFHWSFWMDAGGSPAGGNAWKDNGDGTFTTSGQSPATVKYSMLDLYVMGLADPSEVTPFGLLENAVPPPDVKDPLSRGALYSARSFPWFGDTPFTAKATRRTITIEEIIAANGARSPARWSGALNLGVVLMVKPSATDAEVAALEEQFEPLAASLGPAFQDATHGRGTATTVTKRDVSVVTPDAGTDAETDAGAVDDASVPQRRPAGSSGGCGVAPSNDGPIALAALLAAALVRRRRHTLT